MTSGLRAEHVPSLFPLLQDAEPKVRREAVNALRCAASWHPDTRADIDVALKAALAVRPEDAALKELGVALEIRRLPAC